MQITIETNALWGSPAIAKYANRKIGKYGHQHSILRLMKAGKIPGAQCLGGRWVIARADLDAFLSAQKQRQAA